MNKFFGVFLTLMFLVLSSVASPAFARKSKCELNDTCGNKAEQQSHSKDALDYRLQLPSYSHVLPYAQKLGWKRPISETPFQCDGNGNKVKAPGSHACRDYKDRNGQTWRIPFAHHNATVTKIVRLSDGASVDFDESGAVLADNTSIGSPSSTQEARRERSEPSRAAEGQGQQIDTKEIAEKALGLIKGFKW